MTKKAFNKIAAGLREAITVNQGFSTVPLHTPDGPLQGGDIPAGAWVEYEYPTGRVLKIGQRKIKWPANEERKPMGNPRGGRWATSPKTQMKSGAEFLGGGGGSCRTK